MPDEIVCTRCRNLWPATSVNFSTRNRKSGRYFSSICRACQNEQSKEYYYQRKEADLRPHLDAIHRTVAQIALEQEIPARFMVADQEEVLELENPDHG